MWCPGSRQQGAQIRRGVEQSDIDVTAGLGDHSYDHVVREIHPLAGNCPVVADLKIRARLGIGGGSATDGRVSVCRFWGITPTPYPIPHDGSVGQMLEAAC
ncbi:MAG TPA: hypothetical protein VLL08_16120 [Kineosporiaceae bacterium]|nr:hypothetical protein [Kineosporiaceae bacterium]